MNQEASAEHREEAYNRQTFIVLRRWVPAGEAQVEIERLVIKVYLVLGAVEVERLQGETCTYFRVKCGTKLGESPAVGCEIPNLDKSILVLEGNDGGVGAATALIVHGRQAGV